MGGGGSKTTEVQNRGIPGLLRPYVKDLLTRGQAASGKVSDQPFGGPFLAAATPQEFTAAGMTGDVGTRLGTTAGQSVYNLGQATARGDFLNPSTNPYLDPQIKAMTDEIFRGYQDQSNRTTSSSIAQGAYGGSRAGIEQAILAGNTNRAIGDTTANLLYKNYSDERTRQMAAGDLIQQGVGLNLLGPEVLAKSGADTRQLNQIALDEALAQFNEKNAAPFRPLEPYANLIYGSPSVFTNTGATSKTSDGSTTWGNILGALLGAGGIAGSFM